jgi:hypothetical protein
VTLSTSESARESLYIVVDLCLIAGLLAFYTTQKRFAGWPGAFGGVRDRVRWRGLDVVGQTLDLLTAKKSTQAQAREATNSLA